MSDWAWGAIAAAVLVLALFVDWVYSVYVAEMNRRRWIEAMGHVYGLTRQRGEPYDDFYERVCEQSTAFRKNPHAFRLDWWQKSQEENDDAP